MTEPTQGAGSPNASKDCTGPFRLIEPPTSTKPLDWALHYALTHGLPVFPCGRDKKPLTDHGFKDATSDEPQIHEWWIRWPDASIGIPTGKVSDLVAFDIDPRNGGSESLGELLFAGNELADTVESFTGGGGRHVYFQYPQDGSEVRCHTDLGGKKGIDLKAEGGYVIVPPSGHPSGKSYEWKPGCAFGQIMLAPLPSWILRLANGSSNGPREIVVRDPLELPAEIAEGQRNKLLFEYGCARRRCGRSTEGILDDLRRENGNRCRPPLDDLEIERIAKSAATDPAFDVEVRSIFEGIAQLELDSDPIKQLAQLDRIFDRIASLPATTQDGAIRELEKKSKIRLGALRGALKEAVKRAHLQESAEAEARAEKGEFECPYRATENGIFLEQRTGIGVVVKQLTNFNAEIVEEVTEDDYVETSTKLILKTKLGNVERLVDVTASAFVQMKWVIPKVGAKANVAAGLQAQDHARSAIQLLSKNIQQRTVYTHCGFRKIDGYGWVYLHPGGGIWTNGTIQNLAVEMPGELKKIDLPAPPDGEAEITAARAALEVLKLAADPISFPLFSAIFRAPLGDCDFALSLIGSTGSLKSQAAGVLQSFWGAAFHGEALPASWTSTANYNEALLFNAKDVLVVVDDFNPTGTSNDVLHKHQEADRLLRAHANRTFRGRLSSDGRMRVGRGSRALVVSSCEAPFRGQSLRARTMSFEFRQDTISKEALDRCQQLGRDGVFARALSSYLRRTARLHDELVARIARERPILRDRASGKDIHRRIPTMVADLHLGFLLAKEWLLDIKAITPEEAEKLETRAWAATNEAAMAQSEDISESEPTRSYLELVGEALTSGSAHLTNLEGLRPEGLPAAACGWKAIARDLAGSVIERYEPQGDRIGIVKKDEVFLIPSTSMRTAQRIGSETERLTIGVRTLGRRLSEKKLLLSEDVKRRRHTVRLMAKGASGSFFHLPLDVLGLRYETSNASNSGEESAEIERSSAPSTDEGCESTERQAEFESSVVGSWPNWPIPKAPGEDPPMGRENEPSPCTRCGCRAGWRPEGIHAAWNCNGCSPPEPYAIGMERWSPDLAHDGETAHA